MGAPEGVAEVFAEFADGHQFEQDVPEDALPSFLNEFATSQRDDPFKRVEEAVLSGVDDINHGGCNSF